jgi:hypothetical protein
MIADRVEIPGAAMEVTFAATGDEASKQFRVFALKVSDQDGGDSEPTEDRHSLADHPNVQPISMWHDVPLLPESFVVNMICEVGLYNIFLDEGIILFNTYIYIHILHFARLR